MNNDLEKQQEMLSSLTQRITLLEDVESIRKCLTHYMSMCDNLNAETSLTALTELFSKNAVWEGVGEKYRKSLGRYQGRAEILAMFSSYVSGEAHFKMNAHFLTSENIQVNADAMTATGTWLMLQASTFKDGRAHLNSAQLDIQFVKQDQQWFMDHFKTRNIFSRPISHWDSSAELPVPE